MRPSSLSPYYCSLHYWKDRCIHHCYRIRWPIDTVNSVRKYMSNALWQMCRRPMYTRPPQMSQMSNWCAKMWTNADAIYAVECVWNRSQSFQVCRTTSTATKKIFWWTKIQNVKKSVKWRLLTVNPLQYGFSRAVVLGAHQHNQRPRQATTNPTRMWNT